MVYTFAASVVAASVARRGLAPGPFATATLDSLGEV